MSAIINGVLITSNLDTFNVESDDGINWRIARECITDSGMGNSGNVDHRSNNSSDSGTTGQ